MVGFLLPGGFFLGVALLGPLVGVHCFAPVSTGIDTGAASLATRLGALTGGRFGANQATKLPMADFGGGGMSSRSDGLNTPSLWGI